MYRTVYVCGTVSLKIFSNENRDESIAATVAGASVFSSEGSLSDANRSVSPALS